MIVNNPKATGNGTTPTGKAQPQSKTKNKAVSSSTTANNPAKTKPAPKASNTSQLHLLETDEDQEIEELEQDDEDLVEDEEEEEIVIVPTPAPIAKPKAKTALTVKVALQKILTIEEELGQIILERDNIIRLMLLGLLTRENMVVIGPPGAAKSEVINLFCQRIIRPAPNFQFFYAQLSQSTRDEEVFGPVSIPKFQQGQYMREVEGMLPTSDVAFLDEVFNAPGLFLNVLLLIMNERLYKNGSVQPAPVPLISLFGASNQLPEEKGALWDRFLLRVILEGYLGKTGFKEFITRKADTNGSGATNNPANLTTILYDELILLQKTVKRVQVSNSIIESLEKIRDGLMDKGIQPSDRRFGKAIPILQAQALLAGRATVDEDDIAILKYLLWTRPEEIEDVTKVVNSAGNPLTATTLKLLDEATETYNKALKKQGEAIPDKDKTEAATEAVSKLKNYYKTVGDLHTKAEETGRSTTNIKSALDKIGKMWREVGQIIVGSFGMPPQ